MLHYEVSKLKCCYNLCYCSINDLRPVFHTCYWPYITYPSFQFPPYATNEIGKMGGINRRELGHGLYMFSFTCIQPAGHTCPLSEDQSSFCCKRICFTQGPLRRSLWDQSFPKTFLLPSESPLRCWSPTVRAAHSNLRITPTTLDHIPCLSSLLGKRLIIICCLYLRFLFYGLGLWRKSCSYGCRYLAPNCFIHNESQKNNIQMT